MRSIYLTVLLSAFSRSSATGHASPEARVIFHVMNETGYSPKIRPVLNTHTQIDVKCRFALARVKSVVERELTMTTGGWLHTIWQDDFLQWDPKDWDGVENVILPGNMVWKPEINVLNSVHRSPDWGLNADTRVVVRHTGEVDWRMNFLWYTSCKMSLRKFPFDTQTCDVEIASWTHNTSQMTMTFMVDEVNLGHYEPNNEWDLVSTNLSRINNVLHTIVTMSLTLKRHPAYYVLNIVAPAMLVSLMTLLIFCLPHESGEKVSLGVTVLLSFTVVMLTIIDVSPQGGEGIPIIAIYVVMSLVIAGLSVFLSIVTSRFFFHPGTRPVPNYLRALTGLPRVNKVQPMVSKRQDGDDGVPGHKTGDCFKRDDPVVAYNDCSKASQGDDLTAVLLSVLQSKLGEDGAKEAHRRDWRHVAIALDKIFFCFITSCVGLLNLVLLVFILAI